MNKKMIKRISIFAAIALVAFACTSTKIIGSWKNADYANKQYGHIMVVGLTANVVAKGSVEEQMVEVLSAKRVWAKGAGGIFNPDVKHTDAEKTQISDTLKARGYDGLLTVALISEDKETSYVPGSTYAYAPYSTGYYGSYWGYYGYYAPQVYSPGYYTTNKVFTVEACLYDVDSQKLVWAARSETTDPANLDQFAHEYAETVVFQMQKDKLLKPDLPAAKK
jgi:hypothetical protein